MKELKWGETPWDNKTREELLLEVKRMYSAIISANSCINLWKIHDPESPFWTFPEGTGYSALNKCSQIIGPIEDEYDRENIYRMFYRYADDLLFEGEGFTWLICPKCNYLFGGKNKEEGQICWEQNIFSKDCSGILRKIKWEDLCPIKNL